MSNVKKNNLTKGSLAVLLLSSTVVCADQQYPAADFQPEVLYQNSDYIAKEAPKNAPAKATAPVAKVSASASTEAGSKYPAADFKPEVLYHDTNYKPSAAALKPSPVKVQSSTSVIEVDTPAASATKEESSTMTTYILGLLGLGLAGFFLVKKSSSAKTQNSGTANTTKSYAVNTGVAKYLHKITGTGVSRYINTQEKVSESTKLTGVDKYVANQPQQSYAKAVTGVDKYVRDRG